MEEELSKTQVKKGIVILAVFILLRALATKLWGGYFGQGYQNGILGVRI